MMNRILVSLLIFILAIPVAHSSQNPFFGEHKKQIALNLGAGVNSGFLIPPPSQFVPFAFAHFQYSQSTTFFGLYARESLNLAAVFGWNHKYGWDWADYSNPIAMLSEDIALLHGKNWYAGAGGAIGLQLHQNEREGAKLLIGFKLFTGYRITDSINCEIFMQHFSNANTAEENNSYAFYGLGVVYNF